MSSNNVKSGSAAIANSDTAIDLTGNFSELQIWTNSGAADIHVQLKNGVAAANAADTVMIQAGRNNGLCIKGNIQMKGFHYIGATATGRLNWVAIP